MAEGSTGVYRKPFAVATSKGRVASLTTLESFAIKAASVNSRVLDEVKDGFTGAYAGDDLVEPKFDPGRLKELLSMNTWHARACRTKARDTAGRGWDIVDRDSTPEGAFGEEHLAVKRRLENFETPLVETMYLWQLDIESIGYGAVEISRERNNPRGEIDGMERIPAETLRRSRDGLRYKQKVGSQEVWYKDVRYRGEIDYLTGKPLESFGQTEPHEGSQFSDFSRSIQREFSTVKPENEDRRATEVIYIENPDGAPDIIPAFGAMMGDQSAQEYNASFFQNYGVPSMMLLITGDYEPGGEDDKGVSEMERFIEGRLGELVEEPFSTLVVALPTSRTVGQDSQPAVRIEAVPLSTNVSEAGFRMYRQDNRDEILTANQVDPYRAQIIQQGQLGGNVASEAAQVYKESTIDPKQAVLEHRLNLYFIRDQGRNENSAFKLREIDVRNRQMQAAVAQILFAMGAITPNQIIATFKDLFDLGDRVDHPAMDLHYIGGKPVDSDEPVGGETQKMLEKVEGTLAALAGGPQPEAEPADPFGAQTKPPGPNAPQPNGSGMPTPGNGQVAAPATRDGIFG